MTAYDLLSEPIRRYVRDRGWEKFTPIQSAAIVKIMTTDNNYVLASRTASGKTEAAFLPIFSKVDFNQPGVQVLYISPLIALINDQMERVEELCSYLDVTVTKWHGEASVFKKNKLVESPNGIVLITPESIEAMFQNKPENVKKLFSNLKFVVVDEIHYYFGTERGVHLQSLLYRLSRINVGKCRYVWLSATIGDFTLAKEFFGNPENTKVLIDNTPKPHKVEIRYFPSEPLQLPVDLLKDLYRKTRDKKALVFANSRTLVENVSVKLSQISELVGGHSNYFSHHSSVDRDIKEYAAFFAKHSRHEPFTICCTSTLELGIDIGNVDTVVQIGAPHSVSSMVQRMGRSGRGQDSTSELTIYATNKWELLQALACWRLHEKGVLETSERTDRSYDILLHQMLSIVKERTEISAEELILEMHENMAFRNCNIDAAKLIVRKLVDDDMLEEIGGKLIVGLKAEKYFAAGELYTVFWSSFEYEVLYDNQVIGGLCPNGNTAIGATVFLAAKMWRIIEIDDERMKIYVDTAPNGDAPIYSGKGGYNVSYEVEKEMSEILFDDEIYPILDTKGAEALKELRNEYKDYQRIGASGIPFLNNDIFISLLPLCGTKANKTLSWLLGSYQRKELGHNGEITMIGDMDMFRSTLSRIDKLGTENEKLLIRSMENISWDNVAKFSINLPKELQVRLAYDRWFDLPTAMKEIKGLLDAKYEPTLSVMNCQNPS